MNDEEIQNFLEEMKSIFGEDIPNPEINPIQFNYQCKVTDRIRKKRNEEKPRESERTDNGISNVSIDIDGSSSNNRTVGE